MSDSLGTIYVDLQANTGGFVSALSKAAATAQSAAKDISREFTSLGRVASQTFGAFGDFNPIISKLSFVLQEAGSAASSAMKSLSGLPGMLGPLAALGAGAAVGVASLSAVMVGIAVSAAEDTVKLRDLSRQTGISVQDLSALSFAAKQAGIEQEVLVKSVEILSANMVKASEAPKGAATAFSRLGLEIHKQNGDLKDAAGFMSEVIAKLSEMRDKTAAVGIARPLMGRGGDAMLQADPAELQKNIEYSKQVNPISDDAVAAAKRYTDALGDIGEAAKGVKTTLMIDLLPMLDAVAGSMAKSSSSSTSFLKDLVFVIAGATKWIVEGFDYWGTAFEQVGLIIGHVASDIIIQFDSIVEAAERVAHLDFRGMARALKEGVADQLAAGGLFDSDSKKLWQDHLDFIKTLNGGLPKSLPPPPPSGAADIKPKAVGAGGHARADEIAVMIAKLKEQASAELTAAAATEKGAAAALLSKAAIEAETRITETRTRLIEQEKALRSELGAAQQEAASGTGTGVSRAAGIESEIAGIEKMLGELEKAAPQIREFYAEIGSGEFATKAGKELADFAEKTDIETAASNRMAAAYRQGGQAIVDATAGLKLAPYEKMRADLGELIAVLEKFGAAASIFIAPLRTAFDQLGEGIARATTAEKASEFAKLTEEVTKQTNALRGEAEAYRVTGAAALASAAVQREAAARSETVKFATAHPEATSSVLGEVYANAIGQQNQQYAATVRQEAAQVDLNKTYDDELQKLQDVKAFLASARESTISVDTKIYDLKISHSEDLRKQIFDAQNQELLGQQKLYDFSIQLTDQWDNAAMSVGTVGEKFRAMANEVELAGDNLGQHIFDAMGKAVDGISGQLANFIVTGKSSFLQFFDGIAEQMLKAQIQWSFSKVLEHTMGGPGAPGSAGGIGGPAGALGPGGTAGIFPGKLGIGGALGMKLPGAPGSKGPLGTAGDPIHVTMASAAAAASNAVKSSGGSGGGGSGGPLALGSSGPAGDNTAPTIPSIMKGPSVIAQAARAAAKVFGDVISEVPFPANVVLAPIAAAGVFAGLVAFGAMGGGVASAAGGMLVPQDMLLKVHENERVLPARYSRGLDSLVGSARSSASNGASGVTHVHFTVNGVQDADSFRRSQAQIQSDLQQQMSVAHYRSRGGY